MIAFCEYRFLTGGTDHESRCAISSVRGAVRRQASVHGGSPDPSGIEEFEAYVRETLNPALFSVLMPQSDEKYSALGRAPAHLFA